MSFAVRLRMGFTIRDALGTEQRVALHLLSNSDVSLNSVVTDMVAMAGHLAGVTNGGIISASTTVEILATGFPHTPAEDSRCDAAGNFTFTVPETGKSYSITVYALDPTVVTDGRIDQTNAAVIDWVTTLSNPVDSGVWTNPEYQPLGPLRSTSLVVRRRRAQTNANTRVEA